MIELFTFALRQFLCDRQSARTPGKPPVLPLQLIHRTLYERVLCKKSSKK